MSKSPSVYAIDFNDGDWEELWALSFEPFVFEQREKLTRGQWLALAKMALGKALLIREGRYDMGDGDDDGNPMWADQLDSIARRILEEFQPGDMKL